MKDKRHVGDLGNILVSAENGKMTNIDILDDVISLSTGQKNGIIGKAFVIHADEDDLGKNYSKIQKSIFRKIRQKWSKIVLNYCEKKIIQTVSTIFETECFINLFLAVF